MQRYARTAVLVCLLVFVGGGAGVTHAAASPAETAQLSAAVADQPGLAEDVDGEEGYGDGDGDHGDDDDDYEDESEDEDEDDEDDDGAGLLGDWWGLGGEANEAPYIGIAEVGVGLLLVGVLGYSVVKRKRLLPARYRRYQLQTHQWIVLVGTTLTLPHFAAVDEWEGFGLAVGILLAIEVASGLYGRYLHRHVVQLGRGSETAPVVDRVLSVTKQTLFSRWRRVHVLLTAVTALFIVLHVVVAVGE